MSKHGYTIGKPMLYEQIEAIELCTMCPYDDCISPSYGCDEMKALKASLKAGKPYDGPPPDWGKKPDPQELLDAAWAKMEAEPKPESKPKSKPKPKPKPKPKEPAIELEELPANPVQNTQLHKYNEAIRALEELQPYAINMDTEIAGILGALKDDRATKFGHLVDWDAIARGGNK